MVESGEGGILIKLNVVVREVMVVLHEKVVEFVCGRSDGIGFAERCLEGLLESIPFKGKWQEVVLI